MAARFSDEEVVKATGAQRRPGSVPATYTDVCTDTRALTPGCLFVALQGERFDAHTFLAQAGASGAGGAKPSPAPSPAGAKAAAPPKAPAAPVKAPAVPAKP